MAKWDVEVDQAYGCTQDEAKDKVAGMLDDFQKKNAALVKGMTWNADRTEAKADGKGFDGLFVITDSRVEAKIKLGFALKLMKGKVEQEIRKSLTKAFG